MGSLFFCLLQQIGCRKSIQFIEEKKKIQTIYIYTKHDGGEVGYFGRDGATKRGSSCPRHLAGECLGKQFDPRHSGCRLLRWTPRAYQSPTGLPAFVDDFYAYGPLRENEIVRVRGRKPACTTVEEGSAKRVVSQISLFVRQVWSGEDGHKNVSIAHTVYANSRSSRIVETVEKIEKETGYSARRRWKELYPGQEPAAYFVAKVDVSELQMEKLQKGLPAMRRLLMSAGFGLYQIDYTQNFSETLVRPALVQHLESVHDFFRQGGFAFPENGGCILDNTDSIGDHVCTFVQTRNGRTASTKFYNKVVRQIEAGDVREPFGGHLAHYVDSTNRHLRRSMLYPDVQIRGCTRLEFSLYACDTEDLSQTVAEELIAEALELMNTKEGLFVVQPPE